MWPFLPYRSVLPCYNGNMSPKITNDQRNALRQEPDRPIEIEDEQTQKLYVLMTRDLFRKLVYDDSDITPEEMMAAASEELNDPETWGAPGMEAYDQAVQPSS